ncbi:anti-phage protein KwaA [Roseivirga sp.]|uniref:anti-phage protein KwaA n=1 Tax=Roseivirga sp. TaxID=1964215 RepID=UPI003BACBCEF
MIRKVGLYILSLWLLFFFVIIVTVQVPVSFSDSAQFIGFKNLLSSNYLSLISFFFLIVGFIVYSKFKFDLSGTTNIPFTIVKIESVNYEHLTFLATYIIPLICFNLSSPRYLVVLLFLLIAMGFIYIKTDLFYANPSLALLGFHIYKVDGNFKTGERENIILLTRERLVENLKVSYIKLDERIYYVKTLKNE